MEFLKSFAPSTFLVGAEQQPPFFIFSVLFIIMLKIIVEGIGKKNSHKVPLIKNINLTVE